jgi:hypothetical protein
MSSFCSQTGTRSSQQLEEVELGRSAIDGRGDAVDRDFAEA